jgi:hypothetical protein
MSRISGRDCGSSSRVRSANSVRRFCTSSGYDDATSSTIELATTARITWWSRQAMENCLKDSTLASLEGALKSWILMGLRTIFLSLCKKVYVFTNPSYSTRRSYNQGRPTSTWQACMGMTSHYNISSYELPMEKVREQRCLTDIEVSSTKLSL